MENQVHPSFVTSVRSNAEGEWLQGIENQLSPGMHRVVATDEQGNQDQALLYVVKQEPSIITQVTAWIPPYIGWLIACLFAIILILSGYAIRLGQTTSIKKNEGKRKKQITTHAILVSFILICIAVGLSYWSNKKTGGRLLEPIVSQSTPVEKDIDVRGSIRAPISGEGVVGVDIQAGKTSIRTVQGGQYQFSAIQASEGLKITHPELKIALRKSIEGKDMDIVFDPGLYNALFDLMQREARGRLRPQDGQPIYAPSDLGTQHLFIGKTEVKKTAQLANGGQATEVVHVELWSDGKTKTCLLHKGGQTWEVLECK